MEVHDAEGSCSCDMGSKVLERLEVLEQNRVHADINRRQLGPFEVRDCAVDIVAGRKPETAPERWTRCQGRTPILTDVCGGDEIPLVGAIFENPRQDLRWKPADGNIRVPNRPRRLQNLGEIPLDVEDL